MTTHRHHSLHVNRSWVMVLVIALVLPVLLWESSVAAQFNRPVDTNWPGVTATLVTCQQDLNRLFAVVELHNSGGEKVTGDGALYFKDMYVYDFNNDQKYFVLRDANGVFLAGPRSDFNDGGRWWIDLPPQETVRVWAFFTPLADPTSSVDLFIPQLMPFEEIPVATQPFPLQTEHKGVYDSLQVSLVSANRRTGVVTVRLRLNNTGEGDIEGKAIYYRDAFLYDYRNQRKYPVLMDSDQQYLAEPKSDQNDGGRWWLSILKPGGQQLMSMTFQAPPDSVDHIAIIVPFLLPFPRVILEGSSGVAQEGGIEVLGAGTTIERVLTDLKAEETVSELKLMLDAAVLFDYDQAVVRTEAASVLLSALAVIEEHPSASIRIEGHTDSTGEEDYNQVLSEKRAQAVGEWLIEQGCNPERLITLGHGETRPVASNESDEGRQQNRRVEIIIEKE